jgi:DNA-binding transcriptional LysR family regulator
LVTGVPNHIVVACWPEQSGELRLGCSDFGAVIVGVAIGRMSRRYPRITFEVVSAGAAELHQDLESRNIELFVSTGQEPINKEDFVSACHGRQPDLYTALGQILICQPRIAIRHQHHVEACTLREPSEQDWERTRTSIVVELAGVRARKSHKFRK